MLITAAITVDIIVAIAAATAEGLRLVVRQVVVIGGVLAAVRVAQVVVGAVEAMTTMMMMINRVEAPTTFRGFDLSYG